MKVAVLFSGGKDSLYAIEYAKAKGFEIEYLLSVKPNRKDCFLFHYATAEHTKDVAEMLGIKHILVPCTEADPKKEAEIVANVVKRNPVDLVLLGGTGLQKTQIKSVQEALKPFGVKARASHEGFNHESLLRDMVEKGYKIRITQYASLGFHEGMLNFEINKETLKEFLELSRKYRFPSGGDGGYYDSFVVDSPLFSKKLEFKEIQKIVDGNLTGHLEVFGIREEKKLLVQRV